MKDKLYDILAQLTEKNSHVQGMNYILNILKEVYETRNQMEVFYIMQMFELYNENLGGELSKIIVTLDENVIQICYNIEK